MSISCCNLSIVCFLLFAIAQTPWRINTESSSIRLQVTGWRLQLTAYTWQFVLSVSIVTLPLPNDKLSGFYLLNYLRKLHLTNGQWQLYVFGLEVADCLNDLCSFLINYFNDKINIKIIKNSSLLTYSFFLKKVNLYPLVFCYWNKKKLLCFLFILLITVKKKMKTFIALSSPT